MPTGPRARPRETQRLEVEKATIGGITLLTLQGTLDDGFEGKRLAEAVRSKKLILSMREVRRFASWGMSEWMEFLRITAGCDLYLVECSTYAAGQLNLVTGLLGHSKLVSFYASYRCGSCGEELQNLMLIPIIANYMGWTIVTACLQVCMYLGISTLTFITSMVASQQAEQREGQRRLNSELRATRALLAEFEA